MDRKRFLESLVTAPIAWSLVRNPPASEVAGHHNGVLFLTHRGRHPVADFRLDRLTD